MTAPTVLPSALDDQAATELHALVVGNLHLSDTLTDWLSRAAGAAELLADHADAANHNRDPLQPAAVRDLAALIQHAVNVADIVGRQLHRELYARRDGGAA